MLKKRLLPLNLQFFSEGGAADQQADNQAGGQEQEQVGTDSQQQSEDKTFTQEDVNNFVAKETKKAQEKLLKKLGIDDFENAKQGLQKFQEWQESQKTEQQKQQEQLENLSNEKESLSNENQTLKAQLSALKSGVKGDSVEDVVTLAKNLVSDDVTMDEAIKQVIDKYPHFAEEKQERTDNKPTFTTGNHHTEGNNNDPFTAKLAKYK